MVRSHRYSCIKCAHLLAGEDRGFPRGGGACKMPECTQWHAWKAENITCAFFIDVYFFSLKFCYYQNSIFFFFFSPEIKTLRGCPLYHPGVCIFVCIPDSLSPITHRQTWRGRNSGSGGLGSNSSSVSLRRCTYGRDSQGTAERRSIRGHKNCVMAMVPWKNWRQNNCSNYIVVQTSITVTREFYRLGPLWPQRKFRSKRSWVVNFFQSKMIGIQATRD